MSRRNKAGAPRLLQAHAPVFAALGDETRLVLVDRLCRSGTLSISELSAGSRLTRQAITKHLRVLEDSRLVRSVRQGRKMLFSFSPASVKEAAACLDRVSSQWDMALARLKVFVESGTETGAK